MRVITVIILCLLNAITYGQYTPTNYDLNPIEKTENGDSMFIYDCSLYINDCGSEFPPEYVGGEDSLFSFIRRRFVYPVELKDTTIIGRVFIYFVVDTLGNVVSCELKKGLHPLIDKEALRVVSILPRWIPATCPDRKTKVRYSFVIPIAINK